MKDEKPLIFELTTKPEDPKRLVDRKRRALRTPSSKSFTNHSRRLSEGDEGQPTTLPRRESPSQGLVHREVFKFCAMLHCR
jgi:hypothetical protein